jgi:hypothetical protein
MLFLSLLQMYMFMPPYHRCVLQLNLAHVHPVLIVTKKCHHIRLQLDRIVSNFEPYNLQTSSCRKRDPKLEK